MATSNNSKKIGTVYTKNYDNMRGVSFTGDQTGSKNGRYSYLENMYVDYEGEADAVESIPGFRELHSFGKRINGVYLHPVGNDKEYIIVHAEDELYRFEKGERNSLASLTPIGNIADTKSCAYSFGADVYILDGENLNRLSPDGTLTRLGEDFEAYVPLMYRDGRVCEERNLLTRLGRASFKVNSCEEFNYGTDGIVYEITDYDKRTCRIREMIRNAPSRLVIPRYYVVDGVKYLVTEISHHAFQHQKNIVDLMIHEGVTYIGDYAFFGCTSLQNVKTCSTLEQIGDYAFYGCESLERFYIDTGLKKVGIAVFGGKNVRHRLWVNGPYERIYDIENWELMVYSPNPTFPESYQDNVEWDIEWYRYYLGFKIDHPIEQITGIKIDGVADKVGPFYDVYSMYYIPETRTVEIAICDRSALETREIEFSFILKDETSIHADTRADIFISPNADRFTPIQSIIECKCTASYDGRIFLSGNPRLGGTVFYSALTEGGAVFPTYFGSRSYLIDGLGDATVTSMVNCGGGLAVLKCTDDGGGSIYYHYSGSDKDKYPVDEIYGNIGALGESMHFFGDPVFLCSRGLCALERGQSGINRNLKCRSSSVNPKLLLENINEISMTSWCGYLVLCAGGKIFLADSRDIYRGVDGDEYEWYYLTDVGGYDDDVKVYRYASVAKDGYRAYPISDVPTDKTVYSVKDANGEFVYYTVENGTKYEVYPTNEYTSGTFIPAKQVFGVGNLLFFFTEGGDMYLFNNDLRSMPPSSLSDKEDFSIEEYQRRFGGRIHPEFYSFANHAVRYYLESAKDDCDAPYLTKNSQHSSTVVKYKSLAIGGNISATVNTDRGSVECKKYPASKIAFDTLDFSAFSFLTEDSAIVVIDDGERGWIYKQLSLCTSEFCSPIGVYSMSYQYKIKGKIRNN